MNRSNPSFTFLLASCSESAVLEPESSLPQLDGSNDRKRKNNKGTVKNDHLSDMEDQSSSSVLLAHGACMPTIPPGASSLSYSQGHAHNPLQHASDQTYSSLIEKARCSSLFPLVSRMKTDTLLQASMLQTLQSSANVLVSDESDVLCSKPTDPPASPVVASVGERHKSSTGLKRRHVSLSLRKQKKLRKLSHIAAHSEGGQSDIHPTTVHSPLPPKSRQPGLSEVNVSPVGQVESASLMHHFGEQPSYDQDLQCEKQLLSTTKAVSTVLKLIASSNVSVTQKSKLRRTVKQMTTIPEDTTAPLQSSAVPPAEVSVADESAATMQFPVACNRFSTLESQGDTSSCENLLAVSQVQPRQYSQCSVETVSFNATREMQKGVLLDFTPVQVAPTMEALLKQAKECGIPMVAHKDPYYSNPEDVQQSRYLCTIIES